MTDEPYWTDDAFWADVRRRAEDIRRRLDDFDDEVWRTMQEAEGGYFAQLWDEGKCLSCAGTGVVQKSVPEPHVGACLSCNGEGTVDAMFWMAGKTADPPFYECRRCWFVSYNPNDIANRYCGHCHQFNGPNG